MTTLHTVNKPSQSSPALSLAQSALVPGDTLLLIEDGVFSLIAKSQSFNTIKALGNQYTITALLPDVRARGLDNHLPEWVTLVDYDGFVELTEIHEKTLSWI
ncbi:hypothetical protein GCM10023116_04370 [Kistimonas scapharcae]|uniref:Sulfurtransferase complex subunit TusB n=1 Tax=Kistimonas scapharcae TaxID=1036133 RepID=A0ABP8UYZ7_9GAMM